MGSYWIPKRYLRKLEGEVQFEHVIFVDRGDQNIATVERQERGKWLIRSTNPATTGKKQPPYQMETDVYKRQGLRIGRPYRVEFIRVTMRKNLGRGP